MKATIEAEPNLDLRQGLVERLLVEDGVCVGVVAATGAQYRAKSVVLTAGTSSRGKIIIGELMYSSGPNNSLPSIKLSESLEDNGFKLRRFKTGTPPRVVGNSIDFSKTEEQPGDTTPHHFSFMTPDSMYLKDQLSCWMTYTNGTTHDIIRQNLDRAPMFSGVIKGVGPRYCPSIEDKWCVLLISRATNCSWNQKAATRMNIMSATFQRPCPKKSNSKCSTPLRASNMRN